MTCQIRSPDNVRSPKPARTDCIIDAKKFGEPSASTVWDRDFPGVESTFESMKGNLVVESDVFLRSVCSLTSEVSLGLENDWRMPSENFHGVIPLRTWQ